MADATVLLLNAVSKLNSCVWIFTFKISEEEKQPSKKVKILTLNEN